MQNATLNGKKIGVMVANGFEESQMADIQRTVFSKGANVRIISVESGLVMGANPTGGLGLNFPVDASVGEVLSSDFDMIVVLGGSRSISRLSESAHTKRILNGAMEAGVSVVALNDAVELFANLSQVSSLNISARGDSADVVSSAGATVVEENFVVSGNVLTGWVDDENQAIWEQIVPMLSDSADVRQAA